MSTGRLVAACLAAVAVILCLLVSPALAEDEGDVPGQPYPLAGVEEGIEAPDGFLDQLIDSQAAKELPHRELDREAAGDLIESVFGGLLESSAGPFGELHVEKFLTDNTAIIAPGQSDAAVTIGGEKAAAEEAQAADGPLLLESTLPLRTETDSGQEQVVDLDLEHEEGELQATNPLIDVGIPDELGEGVQLPAGTLELETGAQAEERAPSILADNVAFYPNVAEDTDFAVATTPTGIETFTQLRSADAPQSQTLRFDLQEGRALEETPEGGAVAMSGGQETLKVMPPTAIDANGDSVPVSLEVSGDSLVLNAETDATTAFPVLVDPVIVVSWNWAEKVNNEGMGEGYEKGSTWRAWRNTLAYGADRYVPWSSAPSPLWYKRPGITVTSGWESSVAVGAQANWNYYVPRYFTDYEKFGLRPTSFIQNMQVWNLQYHAYSSQSSPWMAVGLWDEKLSKWVSLYSRNGTDGSIGEKYWSLLYNFPNGEYVQSAKNAGIGLLSSEAGANNGRILYVGYAAVSLNDLTKPTLGSFGGPEKWENSTPIEGIKVEATDSGLGMKYLRFEGEKAGETYTVPLYCTGGNEDPCPRTWNSLIWKGYPAASLTQGSHYYKVTALDVLGNESATAKVLVRIDHTAPTLNLSGTMTQQASLGYKRPQYVLHLDGADGTTGSPQSGIAAGEITVDGKVVDTTKAGCATENCTLSRDWTLKSESYGAGEHKVVATVTDGAGITTTKSLTITIQKDATAPQLQTYGNLRTAPEGWVEQVSRSVGAYAEDAGYGVTSLSFSIDGKVVKSVSQSCAGGNCEGELGASVNMAGYVGGAHSAEVVVKDGAGNVSKDTWTINVNPKGTVPSSEATETLEAADVTSGSTAVAPTSEAIDPAEIADGNDPALVQSGSILESAGTPVESTMTVDAGNGFTIVGNQESFHIEPTKSATSETDLTVTNQAAGVAANTATAVDTVIRPIFNGIQEFQSIRGATAPEKYSWNVQLHQQQALENIDEQHVGIFNLDGTLGLSISAESAHDATGKTVPTSLEASEGNVLTLTVHHQGGGFVYPVTAGPTWQTEYKTVIVPGPPTKEEEELAEMDWIQTTMYGTASAPQFVPSDNPDCEGACDSSLKGFWFMKVEAHLCSSIELPVIHIGGCELYEEHLETVFRYNNKYAWWKTTQPPPYCPADTATNVNVTNNYCNFIGPNHQKYGAGYHISAQSRFHIAITVGPAAQAKDKAMTVYMYGSGYWKEHDTDSLCNPLSSC
jgi:hypothetical protein